METTPIFVSQTDSLAAINRSEMDIQIATAKAYPRNLTTVLNNILTMATMDTETAEDCFYVLKRGENSTIEGLSVRMAEIIASAWGNIRVQTRIIANDGKTITAQGICHDLETNVAVATEVKRSITDRNGRTYSNDMQVVTGNAAAAIAYRNAVLKVVPKAFTKNVINEVRNVALGKSIDLQTSRQNMLAYYHKIGVTDQQIFDYVGVKSIEEIDKESVYILRATANAIKEGTTTVAETFVAASESKKQAEKAKEAAETAKEKVAAAKRAQKASQEEPATKAE